MKIECAPDPDAAWHLRITIDGDIWRTIHPSLFGKHPTLPSVEGLALFEQAFHTQELVLTKRYVLNCLARKQYLSYELHRKLTELLVSQNVISQVLKEVQSLGYLNDEAMIQQYMEKLSQRGYGPQAITGKLRQKGVPLSKIPSFEASFSQLEQIKSILLTRFSNRDLTNLKEKQRAMAYLARRGFHFSKIYEAMD